ncbi:hypothetical protein, partial [Actinomadura sp. KC06]|uniref:hypothetical protein n=1 Tax=Actinomadura sp. KC06 TaxID=2530369 RepID=UPI001A9DB755
MDPVTGAGCFLAREHGYSPAAARRLTLGDRLDGDHPSPIERLVEGPSTREQPGAGWSCFVPGEPSRLDRPPGVLVVGADETFVAATPAAHEWIRELGTLPAQPIFGGGEGRWP